MRITQDMHDLAAKAFMERGTVEITISLGDEKHSAIYSVDSMDFSYLSAVPECNAEFTMLKASGGTVSKPTMQRLSVEQERAMYDSFGRIAEACGKSFMIDIGYEQLPDLVESMIDESLTPQTDREKMLVMALLRKCRGLPVEMRKAGADWHKSDSSFVAYKHCYEYRIPPSKLDLLSEQVEQTLGKQAAEIVKEAVEMCPMMREVFGDE